MLACFCSLLTWLPHDGYIHDELVVVGVWWEAIVKLHLGCLVSLMMPIKRKTHSSSIFVMEAIFREIFLLNGRLERVKKNEVYLSSNSSKYNHKGKIFTLLLMLQHLLTHADFKIDFIIIWPYIIEWDVATNTLCARLLQSH